MTTYEEQTDATTRLVYRAGKWTGGSLIVIVALLLVGCPQYRVYNSEQTGLAELKQAQYNRQVAVLESHAKMESAHNLAEAEVIRAQGAAKANAILQNSLGGPEGYLR